MGTNPYEPPEVPPEHRQKLSRETGVVLIGWFLAAIPAACVCGGITWHFVDVTGEALASVSGYEQDPFLREIGWLIGIPLTYLVTIVVIAITARTLCKRVTVPRT